MSHQHDRTINSIDPRANALEIWCVWPHMSSAAAGGVKVDTKSPARLHAGRYGHADQLLRRRPGPSLHR